MKKDKPRDIIPFAEAQIQLHGFKVRSRITPRKEKPGVSPVGIISYNAPIDENTQKVVAALGDKYLKLQSIASALKYPHPQYAVHMAINELNKRFNNPDITTEQWDNEIRSLLRKKVIDSPSGNYIARF